MTPETTRVVARERLRQLEADLVDHQAHGRTADARTTATRIDAARATITRCTQALADWSTP